MHATVKKIYKGKGNNRFFVGYGVYSNGELLINKDGKPEAYALRSSAQRQAKWYNSIR